MAEIIGQGDLPVANSLPTQTAQRRKTSRRARSHDPSVLAIEICALDRAATSTGPEVSLRADEANFPRLERQSLRIQEAETGSFTAVPFLLYGAGTKPRE